MKGVNFKKICAVICAIALVVSSVTVYDNWAKAADYSTLSYTSVSGTDIAVAALEDFPFQAINALGDGGIEIIVGVNQGSYKVYPDFTNVTLNGAAIPTAYYSAGAAFFIPADRAGLVKDSYNVIEATSAVNGNSLHIVIKYGTPTAGGEIPSQGGEQPSQGGEVTTAAPQPTSSVAPATSTPKQVFGFEAQTNVGGSAIDNSVLLSWASSTDLQNAAGYDTTVTSYNAYIYKNGQLFTRIVNATNGGVVGGLSAGSYQAEVVAVNSKGEGTPSMRMSFTVTGTTLNYTYPVECNGPKSPNGLAIVTANPEHIPPEGNETNTIEVAWAASSEPTVPSYDTTVTGYNIYLFDATTGNPYRRVYVDGIATNYTAIKSVSAGTYLVYLSAVNAAGEESAFSAPGINLASTVTVTGETYDNAQDFGYPDQPTLPIGLLINTDVQYGFTVAWSADADLTGVKLNLYADGVCIKSGINGTESSYYENRLAAGTYTIEIKAQYISNNVESFPISQKVTVAADPGLTTKTPAELADPNYSGYEGEDTTTKAPSVEEPSSNEPSSNEPSSEQPSSNEPSSEQPSSEKPSSDEQPSNNETTKAPTTVAPTTASNKVTAPKKTKVKKATKKKAAKRVKVSIKKVKDANGYRVQFSTTKKFKKVLVTKNVKKATVTIENKNLKNKNKLYVRVKAYKLNGKKKVLAKKWSKAKRVKIK